MKYIIEVEADDEKFPNVDDLRAYIEGKTSGLAIIAIVPKPTFESERVGDAPHRHVVRVRQGYFKATITHTDAAGHVTKETGGWVDDAQRGRLFVAACECDRQAIGASAGEALERLSNMFTD